MTEGITNVNIPACQLLIGMGVPLWRIPQVGGRRPVWGCGVVQGEEKAGLWELAGNWLGVCGFVFYDFVWGNGVQQSYAAAMLHPRCLPLPHQHLAFPHPRLLLPTPSSIPSPPQIRATFVGVEARREGNSSIESRLEVEQFDMENTPQRLPDSHVVAVSGYCPLVLGYQRATESQVG